MCAPELPYLLQSAIAPRTKSRDSATLSTEYVGYRQPKSTDSRESAKVSPLNNSENMLSTPTGAGDQGLKVP